jgi:hypothetical protein
MLISWFRLGSVRLDGVFTVYGTRAFLDRHKTRGIDLPVTPSTMFGNWYATLLGWRPDVALFMNETTFLPVFVRLTPASSLLARFPAAAGEVMAAVGVDPAVIVAELVEVQQVTLAKTADRQKVGVMVEHTFMANRFLETGHDPTDLTGLAVGISRLLIGPLYKVKGGPGNPAEAARQHATSRSSGGL